MTTKGRKKFRSIKYEMIAALTARVATSVMTVQNCKNHKERQQKRMNKGTRKTKKLIPISVLADNVMEAVTRPYITAAHFTIFDNELSYFDKIT
mmetsp:Transcript_39600/g.45082  ORF Transcript_39600/g.45082 Transcript_39600/m.45082 type:complete len:94 (-) Transcript_39600:670-951(-)